ncbi:MAG: YhgE/Pip domain-containing protein, partial [Clostridiales bacterium]|nr:YhgE/Pip domain-containing protein [Clostridiales bacterium]
MRALKIAIKDIKELFTNRFNRVAVIVVALMPLLYSYLYLYAFWDPYSKLDKMPVAVVNLDKGSVKDGENVNYGNDLVDELRDNTKIKWEFVDYNKAMDGLNNEGYYSVVIVPEDFSKRITDTSDGKVDKAHLVYIPNEKKNFLAAQVSSRVMLELKDEVAKSITEEASKVVIDSLYDVKDGLKEAKDGTTELNDGAIKLRDGSYELKNGLKTANEGAGKLKEGSNQLKNGLVTLDEGALKLDNGADALKQGLKTASDGSKQLTDGLFALKDGQNSFTLGFDKLISGIKQLGPNAGLQKLYEGATKLEGGLGEIYNKVSQFKASLESGQEGITQLVNGSKQVADGLEQLNTNIANMDMPNKLNSAATGIENVSDAIDNAKALMDAGRYEEAKLILAGLQAQNLKSSVAQPLKEAAVGATNLTQVTSQLASGAKQVAAGTKQVADTSKASVEGLSALLAGLNDAKNGSTALKDGLDQANTGISQIAAGTDELKAGADKIGDGLNTATQKTGKLSDGLEKLYVGSNELKNGTSTLKDGSTKLKDGSFKLNDGLISLADGTLKLYDGSTKLNDGLVKLADGTEELKNGLNDGYDEINNKLKFTSDDMSKFMSEPVKLDEQPINHVPDYGTGFAPYFIPLSLWVGALIMFFIVSSEVEEKYKGHSACLLYTS